MHKDYIQIMPKKGQQDKDWEKVFGAAGENKIQSRNSIF